MNTKLTILLTAIMAFSVPSAIALNVNSATAEEMANELKGVGPVLAKSIVDYRELEGPFESMDQFIDVKGIGRSVIENNIDEIQFSDDVIVQ